MLKPYIILVLFVSLFVSGCTPKIQEIGSKVREASLNGTKYQTEDGIDIPLKVWPANEEATAVIVAVHGFNDYRNGFAFPGSWWAQNGITTYAYDQRGFGENGQAGIWAGEDQLIKDLAKLVKLVKRQNPGTPVYLLGESMGGAVVISSVTSADFPIVDGVILSAPAVWGWRTLNPFYRFALWSSAHLFPGVTATGKNLGIQASDNISMLRNLGRDPFFIKETRIDSVYGLVGLMDLAYGRAKEMELPVLLLYGAKDEVIPKDPVEEVVATMGKNTDIVLYDDGWHLLMRDLQAPVVWNDIKSWIANRSIPSGNRVSELPLFNE